MVPLRQAEQQVHSTMGRWTTASCVSPLLARQMSSRLKNVPVGPTPAGIVMSPDNRYLLVAIMGEGYVEVIDWRAQKTVKKVPTDTAAHNIHPRGDGRHYFVSNRSVSGGSISLLDTQTMTVVEKYDVPGGPDDMEVRADGKELWATARFARRVQVIDLTTKTLKTSIPVGSSPHGVFFLNHAARK